MKFMRNTFIAIALGSTLALAACSSDSGGDSAESAGQSEDKVTVTETTPPTDEADEAGVQPEQNQGAQPTKPQQSSEQLDPNPTESERECASTDAQQALNQSVDRLPLWNDVVHWNADQAELNGYDPCSDLSYIIVPLEDAVNSSPYQIMLFHRGEYIGTATEKPYGFHPDVSSVSDGSIKVTYRWPKKGEDTSAASGRTTAQFTWNPQTQQVDMTGEVPSYEH